MSDGTSLGTVLGMLLGSVDGEVQLVIASSIYTSSVEPLCLSNVNSTPSAAALSLNTISESHPSGRDSLS
jgi:hypothetical protein